MIKIYNYEIDKLKSIRKKNIIFGISFFIIGFVVSLLLLLLHDRENSVIMEFFSILSIVVFSILGLIFILILNAPIFKLIDLIKKEKNALINVYVIEKVEENLFSEGGLTFKKIHLKSDENENNVFFIDQSVNLVEKQKIQISSVNSIIVSYEVLK